MSDPVQVTATEAQDRAAAIQAIEAASAPPPAPATPAATPQQPPAPVAAADVPAPVSGPSPLSALEPDMDEIARIAADRRARALERRAAVAQRPTATEPAPTQTPQPTEQITARSLADIGIDVNKLAEERSLTPAEFLYIVNRQVAGKAGPWKPPHATAMTEIEKLNDRLAEMEKRDADLRSELASASRQAVEQQQRVDQERRSAQVEQGALRVLASPEFRAKHPHIAVQDATEMARAFSVALFSAADNGGHLTPPQIFASMESELAALASRFRPIYEKAQPPAPAPAAPKQTVAAPQSASATPTPPARTPNRSSFPELAGIRLTPRDNPDEIAEILRGIEQASVG